MTVVVRRVVLVALLLMAVLTGVVWEQHRARRAFLLACEAKTAAPGSGCGCFE